MKNLILAILFLAFSIHPVIAQPAEIPTLEETPEQIYRAEYEKVNNIVHTKLKVKFDFSKRQLIGEEWITLKPHFYNTQTVTLDAKAMLIHKVTRNGKALKYDYDGLKLTIELDNIFVKDEEYTLHISYTARPEEVTQLGSDAISDAQGLYFVDPDESDPDKPTQIWTQGETESNSCWFPTIDSPNQKTSQEIYITVPEKYVTLSNGLLISQSENSDGTRTDYWKLDQKHAPYLFFMGIGEFSIVEDKWNNIPVDYYVEKEYEPFAKEIFGHTPEMMTFFSDITGIKYPWPKYAQIICRDYISGAMENTTAVIHAENAYQTSGELIDENIWEDTIAHEVFHHWFGDLVTAESWSNITVNESFANYSEYLWREYKYGKDHAEAHRYADVQGYLNGANESKHLVRFNYQSREDMFDAVSYNKGGYILHMLREYLGDKAFYAGMKEFLSSNQYQTGEAHQLRLAFEKISGKDLNWFFNQWYFGAGHPKLEIDYKYDDPSKSVTISIKQLTDKVFQFPLPVDVYEVNTPKRYNIWIKKKEEEFTIKYDKKPRFINIDANKTLLAEIKDVKTIDNYIFQYEYQNAHYLDRREAITALASEQSNKEALQVLIKALNDPYHGIRLLALDSLNFDSDPKVIQVIEKLATSDPKTLVRAKAVKILSTLNDMKYVPLFKEALKSKSYAVQSNALKALFVLDRETAMEKVASITDTHDREGMSEILMEIFIREQNVSEMPFVAGNLNSGMLYSQDESLQQLYAQAWRWVVLSDNVEATQIMVNDFVSNAKRYRKYGIDKINTQLLEQVLEVKIQQASPFQKELIDIVKRGIEDIK
ncbi:MAG: M1 family metallopeptidase [Flavobacteriaceae bacterium]|nr:M1 family metallopeptidase [Flavobacteriaceae bacterium]